jgi:murein DD-endopeptidase MepM/ murein hydrolase activator NlpD
VQANFTLLNIYGAFRGLSGNNQEGNMSSKSVFKLLPFLWAISAPVTWAASLPLTTIPFTDTGYPDIEPAYSYGFDYPVKADILNAEPEGYSPVFGHRYFMSVYGPRYKQVSTSNVGFFDFHQGADIIHDVTYDGIVYDDNNPPDIFSACKGIVDKINDGPDSELEQTGSGRWIRIKCDTHFTANPGWGNIYLAYRHLASIDPAVYSVGASVAQGQRIALMGESGETTTVHLHYSVRRYTGSDFINVHPARVFDPLAIPHLMAPLSNIEIRQMTYSSSDARFRLLVPYNEANIRAITVKTADNSYSRTYDFEAISEYAGSDRDNNDYVAGLELYAYAFNRGYTAYRRYLQKLDEFPPSYPASLQHPAINFRPLLNEGILQTPAYVLDVIAKNLPVGYGIDDLSIEVIDIWGNGIRAFGDSSQNLDSSAAFVLLDNSEDDAEEHQDGTVDVTSMDLEMVNDGTSRGDQLVGLRFRDVKLPQGANIDKAFIQFSADEENSEPTSLQIQSEATDNSTIFTTNQQISLRSPGLQAVNWSPGPWTVVNEVSLTQQTPDLSPLVQEVTDRSGWSESSALGFLISGSGKRVADSGDNVYYRAPYFYAEYNTLASNLPPVAAIEFDCTELDCNFDGSGSSDSDGNIVNYSWDFGDTNSGSGEIEAHSYVDDGSYNVRLTVIDDQGASHYSNALVSVSGPTIVQDDAAVSDFATNTGNTSGNYSDTHDQDNRYQSLTEQHSGGKPSRRYDKLDHIWQFDLTGGNSILNINAYVQPASGDADTGFHIQWSDSANGPWNTLITVNKTTDDDTYQTAGMGNDISGTIFIRAIDNDSTPANLNYTTLHVDHLLVSGGSPPTTPPDIASLPQPENGSGGESISIQLNWTSGANTTSHDVYFGSSDPPAFIQNQDSNSFDPGLLSPGITYYWRIDGVNAVGTTAGPLWTFSTSNITEPSGLVVDSIILATVKEGKLGKRGRSTVTIKDDLGNPVSGAAVGGEIRFRVPQWAVFLAGVSTNLFPE